MKVTAEARVLLLDFCGEEPLLALAEGKVLQGEERLAGRSAAAGWLPAARRLLEAQRWRLDDLDAVGVVGGPGSFTGVRTGLAAAKGLCEAASLELAVVSRLAVLAEAAERGAMAALYAGRDQLYLRMPEDPAASAKESLTAIDEVIELARTRAIAIAEARLLQVLPDSNVTLVAIHPEHILAVVHEALQRGGATVADADANYVRAEADIYRKASARLASAAESPT